MMSSGCQSLETRNGHVIYNQAPSDSNCRTALDERTTKVEAVDMYLLGRQNADASATPITNWLHAQ